MLAMYSGEMGNWRGRRSGCKDESEVAIARGGGDCEVQELERNRAIQMAVGESGLNCFSGDLGLVKSVFVVTY